MIVTIIVFILILGFLIFIHEIGHFATARMAGVKVEEFGIGYPPRIYAVRRGETEYSLNWIPLGGFCKLLGEEDPAEPRSLASKRPGTRLLILSAGSLAMFIIPFILIPIGLMIPHEVVVGGEGIKVSRVESGSPAELAGIEVDDVILSAGGTAVVTDEELIEAINAHLGKEMTMVLRREAAEVHVVLVPREEYPSNQGPVGIGLAWEKEIKEREWFPFWEAIPKGVKEAAQMYGLFFEGIGILISGAEPFVVTGIVGIAQATGEVAKWGLMSLVGWTCFLSINLGIINLLPLPALDGGRIVFVLLEVARKGKRVSPRTEGLVHLIGFVMLIGLMLVVSYYDIVRVISGEPLLQ